MENLPIDIHSSKLQDWIITRRLCKKDWQTSICKIREKVQQAMMDMPENDKVKEILQGSFISYFHCRDIVNVLNTTEENSKNIFGFYSSQRMKDWQEIIQLYQSNNIYLIESANLLQKSIEFEIPALRRQLSKTKNLIEELLKNKQTYLKQSSEAKKGYQWEVTNKWGIDGINIRQELQEKVFELGDFFSKIFCKIKLLRDAVDLYYKFVANSGVYSKQLYLFDFLCNANANNISDITLYEWRHKRKPEIIDRAQFDETEKDAVSNTEIDLDLDLNDFESTMSIQCSENLDKEEHPSIARGEEILFPLENVEILYAFLAELKRIKSFFKFLMINETFDKDLSNISLFGIEHHLEHLQIDENFISKSIIQINELYQELANQNIMRLVKLKSDKKYINQVILELDEKKKDEEKYLMMAKLVEEKMEESYKTLNKLQKNLDLLINGARYLQSMIEKDISIRYNNREVYIMGEINAVLYD